MTTTETRSEPPQPSRLEKKTNIGPPPLPGFPRFYGLGVVGVVVVGAVVVGVVAVVSVVIGTVERSGSSFSPQPAPMSPASASEIAAARRIVDRARLAIGSNVSEGAGGRIRTCDTRIMIPLL